MIVPVILCGGSGTRLWPLSRSSYPKQFVDLGKGRTLFKETIGRSKEATKSEEDGGNTPYVVTSESHRFYAQANLFECNQKANIIVEPIPRNTAPAIASVAYCAYANDHDVILLVMPSDHVFEKAQEFNAAVERGRKLAEKGYLVTFGIRPTSPETGFGYIKQGATLDEVGYIVEKFIEKPKKDLAEQFLSSGNF